MTTKKNEKKAVYTTTKKNKKIKKMKKSTEHSTDENAVLNAHASKAQQKRHIRQCTRSRKPKKNTVLRLSKRKKIKNIFIV